MGAAIAWVFVVDAGHASACSLAGPAPHELDPAEVGVDVTPPTPPRAVATVTRSETTNSAQCGGFGTITLTIVDAADDRTPREELGFRVVIEGGKVPPDMHVLDEPQRLFAGKNLFLHFSDPDPDDQESFAFQLRLISVDLAGNESEPSEVIGASDPGGSGCALARGTRPSAWPGVLFAVVLAALALRRKSS